MYSRLRRNSPTAQQIHSNSLSESLTSPRLATPGALVSCMTILVIIATTYSLRHSHSSNAATEATVPDVIVVTASIDSCVISSIYAENLGLHEGRLSADLTAADATLAIDCSYVLAHDSSSSSTVSQINLDGEKQEQKQEQQPQRLPNLLKVAGLDALTCAVRNKLLLLEQQQQQRQHYVFLLHRTATAEGLIYHVVEYAPLPASSTDSQAVLLALLSGWGSAGNSQLGWKPLGCYSDAEHITALPGSNSSSSSSSRTGSVAKVSTTTATPPPAQAAAPVTKPQRQLLQETSAAPGAPSPTDSSPPSPPDSLPPSPSPVDGPVPPPSPSPGPSSSPDPVLSAAPSPSPSPSSEAAGTNSTTGGGWEAPDAANTSTDTNVTSNAGPQESLLIVVNATSGRLLEGVNASFTVAQLVCSLDTATGPCRASIKRWAFDANKGSCRNFTYGGCQGNQNNFESKDLCEQVCLPAMTNTTANVTNMTEPDAPVPPLSPFTPVSYKTEQLPDLVVTESGVDYASPPPPTSDADILGIAVSVFAIMFAVLIEFLLVY